MCNLSKGVEEKGIVILKQIFEKFGLTEETAETYLKEIC